MSNQPDVQSLLRRAAENIKKGENSQAQQVLKEALKLDGRSADAYYLASFAVEDNQARIKALERCLTLNPNYSKAKERLDKLRPPAPPVARDPFLDLLNSDEPKKTNGLPPINPPTMSSGPLTNPLQAQNWQLPTPDPKTSQPTIEQILTQLTTNRKMIVPGLAVLGVVVVLLLAGLIFSRQNQKTPTQQTEEAFMRLMGLDPDVVEPTYTAQALTQAYGGTQAAAQAAAYRVAAQETSIIQNVTSTVQAQTAVSAYTLAVKQASTSYAGQQQTSAAQVQEENLTQKAYADQRTATMVFATQIAAGATQTQIGMLTRFTGRIAFVTGRNGNSEIYAINANGTSITRLTDNSAENSDPTWSADGKQFAFATKRDGKWNIYIANTDGAGLKRLTDNQNDYTNPGWSADGKLIAFTVNRGKGNELAVMNADGSGQHDVTTDHHNNYRPYFSPDSKQIVFSSDRGDGGNNIFIVNVDGTNLHALTTTGKTGTPSWSPDGKTIFFEADRGQGYQVFAAELDGSNQRQISKMDGGCVGETLSPDGIHFACINGYSDSFMGTTPGKIYIFAIDGSIPPILIPNSESYGVRLTWTR